MVLNSLLVRNIAKNRILACRVIIGENIAMMDMRYGFGYDCIFEKDRIVLCYYKSPKSSAGLECIIPYEDIEKVEFSVVRTPIRHWLNKTYNYALDINIYTSEKLDNQMFRLETRAFKILMLLKDKIDSENIKICDKLEVINKYAGKEYEYIQLDLDKCYDTLIKEYSLEKLRTTDLIK